MCLLLVLMIYTDNEDVVAVFKELLGASEIRRKHHIRVQCYGCCKISRRKTVLKRFSGKNSWRGRNLKFIPERHLGPVDGLFCT